MNALQTILTIIETATAAAAPIVAGIPGAGEADALVAALAKIALSASQAHQQITGQPIDLLALQPIDPVA